MKERLVQTQKNPKKRRKFFTKLKIPSTQPNYELAIVFKPKGVKDRRLK